MKRIGGAGFWAAIGCAAGLALLTAGGCVAPRGTERGASGEIDPNRIPTRDDIKQIIQYWQPEPWLYDADRKPVGFRAAVYFVSGATDKGAFVPGKIQVNMYVLEPSAEGPPTRVPVHQWDLPESESTLYRVRRESVQGYFYGFQLLWPPDLNIIKRQVEFVIEYQRLDGRVLAAPGRRFDVEVPSGYQWQPARSGREGWTGTHGRDAPESTSRTGNSTAPTTQPGHGIDQALIEQLRAKMRRAATQPTSEPGQ